jgi:L-iditol 2-dehydrogenase
MKAFVKYGKKPYEAALRDIPIPKLGPEDVLIQVAGCGICGSDLHAYSASIGYEWVKPPVTLGHEFAGTVVSVGSAVNEFTGGELVVVIGVQGCGTCTFCRSGDTNLCYSRKVIGLDMDGGMASHAVIHRRQLIQLREGIDLMLAVMTEPLSVAVHALSKVKIQSTLKVVVTGVGPIGLLCALIAAQNGCSVLCCGTATDASLRLPTAKGFGLEAVNTEQIPLPEAVHWHFGPEPPDLWIEASGAIAPLDTSIRLLKRGGTLIAVGIYDKQWAFLASTAVRSELTVHFTYGSTFRDYVQALQFMRTTGIDLNAIAQKFPIDHADEAFREVEAGRTLKAIIIP